MYKEFILAPGHGFRPFGSKIDIIVVHATANSTLEGVICWFLNKNSKVSAHYVIGKDGRTVQMVPDNRRAWHAGAGHWGQYEDVNDHSIGIELVNRNTPDDPYPKEQLQALGDLCVRLVMMYNIPIENIVGHKDTSSSGKTDPAYLDLQELRDYVSEEVYRHSACEPGQLGVPEVQEHQPDREE